MEVSARQGREIGLWEALGAKDGFGAVLGYLDECGHAGGVHLMNLLAKLPRQRLTTEILRNAAQTSEKQESVMHSIAICAMVAKLLMEKGMTALPVGRKSCLLISRFKVQVLVGALANA